MRDAMKQGDQVFFYHSNANPPAIMGIAKVVREAYADHFAFDPNNHYYDPKSTPEKPIWLMVDIQYERDIIPPIGLPELRTVPGLESMMLLQKGSRLSVQPVTPQAWEIIQQLRPRDQT